MSTETIKVEIETVADLIAALERIEDKTATLTVEGEAGGCYSCTAENFDRKIHSIESCVWDTFNNTVELKI